MIGISIPTTGSTTRLGHTLDAVVTLANQDRAALDLAFAAVTGRWHRFARVTFGELLSPHADAALGFDPIGNHPARLHPVGLIQRLRAITYAFSRRSRGAAEPPHRT